MDGEEDYSSKPGDTARGQDTNDMTFVINSYLKDAMKIMNMMRSHNLLTDIILEVGSESFQAHKVVLAAASPYFKAMFTGGLMECGMTKVKLQGVNPTAMAKIIVFMYTGTIRVTEPTVCQVLPAATMLQVANVVEACCTFLERQLDPTNAIGIAAFAEQHGCRDLLFKANRFIEQHFTQICQEEEFLQLSPIQLIELIRKDELNVQEEREVYNAVIKWVRYNEETRKPKMEAVLRAVRCQFLSPAFLQEQMRSCDIVTKLPACRDYLSQIFTDLTLHKRIGVKERTPKSPRIIYVAGGYLRHSLDTFEGFNIDDNTWTALAKLPIPRSGLGVAFLKGAIYAVGGRNNSPGSSYDSDWIDRYDPVMDVWRPCTAMSTPRNRVGVCVMDGLLYACGGSTGADCHNSAERYDPDSDQWTRIKSMKQQRIGVGVAVINRLLYAVGGFDGESRLRSVECYNPDKDSWSFVADMHECKSGAGVAALEHHIYVVGGYNGSQQLDTVERYDPEQDRWEFCCPLSIARSALSLAVIDNKVYAIGGYDGRNFISVVEVYDPTTNTWTQGTPMLTGRSGHAAAVCYQHQCLIPCEGPSHVHAPATTADTPVRPHNSPS
ncbi:kelch-like ECH-associated protein 1B [Homalodisca vitripennis]|nr:kelch-like ECH-associated protein 1B [Homalodisca vitripennis]